ncbi:hypothetical protein JKP88DRAFT_245992 [Tribonema minus]|uniref:FAD-binding FR-type domain-containing protein n=1 Tax=Tribonema minus TaxID=303371 RepID=A0A835Z3Z2_9STRA|nr:hypothetical protein JKP88DRAFT_245992 [Tribonema minus]
MAKPVELEGPPMAQRSAAQVVPAPEVATATAAGPPATTKRGGPYGPYSMLPIESFVDWRDSCNASLRDATWLFRTIGTCGFTVLPVEILLTALTAFVLLIYGGSDITYSLNSAIFLGLVFFLAPRNSIVTVATGVSFERLIKYHQWAAYLMVIPMTLHGLDNDLFTDWSDSTQITGNALYITYLTILTLSLPPIRRRLFEGFYVTHVMLAAAMVVLGALHAGTVIGVSAVALVLLAIDFAWRWVIAHQLVLSKMCVSAVALVLLAINFAWRWVITHQAATIVGVRCMGGNSATELSVSFNNDVTRKSWRYESGQYSWICVPRASSWQWHPISISSAPAETLKNGVITFHILSMGKGKWSDRIQQVQPGDSIRLSGPHGVCSVTYEHASQLVLAGGGIGITPMMSTLSQLVALAEANPVKPCGQLVALAEADSDYPCGQLRRVHLIWVLREWQTIGFFEDTFQRIQRLRTAAAGNKDLFEFAVSIYLTKTSGAAADWLGEVPPSVHSDIKQGRPKWSDIMADEKNATLPVLRASSTAPHKRISVLVCGPALLMSAVTGSAERCSTKVVRFQVHQESFLL